MKKTVALILSVLMLALLVVSPAAFAEPAKNVTIQTLAPTAATSGSTITVTASVTANEGFSSITILPVLGEGLTFGEWKAGSVTGMGYDLGTNALLNYTSDDTAAAANYTGTTTNLVSFTVTLPEAEEGTTYEVGFKFLAGACDADEVDVNGIITTATVTVKEGLLGDASGDGVISTKDAAFIRQYVAGWDVKGIRLDLADVTGDKNVTTKDAAVILQYIAGWEVAFPVGQ
ncbi:MAG: dockerin type I repeat-containing protein [Clostridia bacterium]|nr:dockerin type I repeat-containing protein [Clostridia bacterium]